MATFLTITPEQSSQSEIEDLLGEADGTEEPLLSEWTWVYLCGESDDTRLRVTFNTSDRPFRVSKLNYYNPKLDVAKLLRQFGPPELVYKEKTENQTEETTKFIFAYPSIGLFASTISTSIPTPSDEIIELNKEMPKNTQQFLTELSKRIDVEIIEWPIKEPN